MESSTNMPATPIGDEHDLLTLPDFDTVLRDPTIPVFDPPLLTLHNLDGQHSLHHYLKKPLLNPCSLLHIL